MRGYCSGQAANDPHPQETRRGVLGDRGGGRGAGGVSAEVRAGVLVVCERKVSFGICRTATNSTHVRTSHVLANRMACRQRSEPGRRRDLLVRDAPTYLNYAPH